MSSSSSIFASRSGSTEPSGWGAVSGLEGAHDVHERVHPAQGGQVDERRALALRDAGHVHVLDGGEGLSSSAEDLAPAGATRGSGTRAMPTRGLGPAPGGGRRGAGEELEEGALAGEGEPEDAGFHAGDYSGARSLRRRGRARVVESGVGMLPALLALALQAGPAPPGEGAPSPPPPGEGPVILFLVDNSASLPPLDPEEKRVVALEKMFGFLRGTPLPADALRRPKDEIAVDDVSATATTGSGRTSTTPS